MRFVGGLNAVRNRTLHMLITWGVQVLRYPNFFLGEWKQIET